MLYGQSNFIISFPSFVRIEVEQDDEVLADDSDGAETPENTEATLEKPRISWLLQVALENLGITISNYIVRSTPTTPTAFDTHRNQKNDEQIFSLHILQAPSKTASSVKTRHQCLQILIAMGRHIEWVKNHLDLIAIALQKSIADEEAAIQLRAARCLDVVANAINLHLLAQSNQRIANFDELTRQCLRFWNDMMPLIGSTLQQLEQSASLKSTLCDALSNIGVHIFERLEVSNAKLRQFEFNSQITFFCVTF